MPPKLYGEPTTSRVERAGHNGRVGLPPLARRLSAPPGVWVLPDLATVRHGRGSRGESSYSGKLGPTMSAICRHGRQPGVEDLEGRQNRVRSGTHQRAFDRGPAGIVHYRALSATSRFARGTAAAGAPCNMEIQLILLDKAFRASMTAGQLQRVS